MKSPPAPLRHRTRHNRGFALVMVLSLLVLLALLAVGMLSLAASAQRQANAAAMATMARDNARMALVLAIGDLQLSAGPDQRVTSTADIAGDDRGDALDPGDEPQTDLTVLDESKGLTALQAGTRHWTAAWRVHQEPLSPSMDDTQGIYIRTPRPSLVQWLVSSNPAEPPMRPDSATVALTADGSVVNSGQAALLVGPGTLGTSDAAAVADFVAAPSVAVRSAVTGSGRYAWWVGDEGVKAAMHIATTNDDGSYASLTAQRRAWERIDGLGAYPVPPDDAAILPKLATFRSTDFLAPEARPALRRQFHSATVDSRGVIADSLLGGTRIDLTTALAGDLGDLPDIAGLPNAPASGGTIIPQSVAPSMRAPVWDTLKTFRDRAANAQNSELLVAPAADNYTPSTAPLIADFRVLLGVRFVPEGPRETATSFRINPCAKVAFTLANPYPVPLRWDQDLEIQVFCETPPGNQPSRVWNLGGNSRYMPPSSDRSQPAVFNNTFFRIPAGVLGPGEARAYTQPAGVLRPRNNQRIVIDLAPFAASNPFDFNHSLELETTGVYSPIPALDVRESWTTSLMSLEMRLAGQPASTRALGRVERFELDNGYFRSNIRQPTIEEARELEGPIGLMLYSFQISQPGADYMALMPAGYELGQRASAVRTFADFNLQASIFPKQITSYNPAPFFMEHTSSIAQLPGHAPGGETGTAFTRNLVADPLPWGRSPFGPPRTILFDLPDRIASIAQLQHADLTGDDRFGSISHQPGNAVGNSHAPVWVRRGLTIQERADYEVIGSPNQTGANYWMRNYYDISYLLNAALWDSYFFSTIGADGKPEVPVFTPVDPGSPALHDPVACAANLMIEGAFNVNSTSKDAWRAFLASSDWFSHPADPGQDGGIPFPRSLSQTAASAIPASGTQADSYAGYRRLTDEQLDALVDELVRQVRLRGPFLSLSHFVNRAIGDSSPQASASDIGRRRMMTRAGALQVAIDEAGINLSHDGSRSGFQALQAEPDRARLAWKQGAPRADMDGGRNINHLPNVDPSEPDWAVTSIDLNYGTMASIAADRWMLSDAAAGRELGYRSTGIPGWLTQADVLQVIGPSLSARSDTFRVRAYGEARDDSERVRARAWCEAVVQRMPEFIDPDNAATDRGSDLTRLNQRFGRRFEIISFRWLSEDEI